MNPTLLAPDPAAWPGAVPAAQAAAGGSRTTGVVTLSHGLPVEKPPGVGSFSLSLSHEMHGSLLGFSPATSLRRDVGCVPLVLALFSI